MWKLISNLNWIWKCRTLNACTRSTSGPDRSSREARTPLSTLGCTTRTAMASRSRISRHGEGLWNPDTTTTRGAISTFSAAVDLAWTLRSARSTSPPTVPETTTAGTATTSRSPPLAPTYSATSSFSPSSSGSPPIRRRMNSPPSGTTVSPILQIGIFRSSLLRRLLRLFVWNWDLLLLLLFESDDGHRWCFWMVFGCWVSLIPAL